MSLSQRPQNECMARKTIRVSEHAFDRRRFLEASAAAVAMAGTGELRCSLASTSASGKVVVGAHPWVYAATQPNHDITPISDTIFADIARSWPFVKPTVLC